MIRPLVMQKMPRILALILLLTIATSTPFAWAQTRDPTPGEGAAACAACSAIGGTMVLIPIVLFVLNIALLVWVARDAKSRGMDSSVLWMILVMFTSILGLVIYLFARPQGELRQCLQCKNTRLKASAKCPHCGNA